VAAGDQYFDRPIISEFLPNPAGLLETEWIELFNPSTFAVNLHEYKIGDALGLRNISDTDLYLPPGEYIVLADDVGQFLEYYNAFSGLITSPVGWQILNNSGGETVRLTNLNDDIIDSVYYDGGFADNRSWERFIGTEGRSFWGGSFSPNDSSPGKPNSFFYPRAESIDLSISPNPFSPDADGFEDVTIISFNPPQAKEFDLVIYDISGRTVKTFFESGHSVPGEIAWDGRGDEGRTLPIGIYIVYARIEGERSMETKKTIVIAR
jgi:hypothetical protein